MYILYIYIIYGPFLLKVAKKFSDIFSPQYPWNLWEVAKKFSDIFSPQYPWNLWEDRALDIDQKSAAVSALWKLLIGLIDQLVLILVSRP